MAGDNCPVEAIVLGATLRGSECPDTTARVADRGSTVPATVTSDTAGKLQLRLDVPSRISSDLLLFKASQLRQSQEYRERGNVFRALSLTVR